MPAANPWPTNTCDGMRAVQPHELERFMELLNESTDERPLQAFLNQHRHFLSCLLEPGRNSWCFDRPRLGSELIPDFLLSTHNSSGYKWRLVEIESPTKSPLTRAGVPSQALNTALVQVRDWRGWLRSNISYAQSELGFTGLNAEAPAFVIIGRRASIPSAQLKRYEELSTPETTVMTWDRFADTLRRG